MAITQIPSFQQILGRMQAKVLARLGINDFNPGSVINTNLEASADNIFQIYESLIQILDSFSLKNISGAELRRRAREYGVPDKNPVASTGYITISDDNVTKISTTVYAAGSPPIIGDTVIKVLDASDFTSTGSLYIGRGTANYEGPIPYTAVTNNGTYYTITLSSPLTRNHDLSETVILAQRGNRIIPPLTSVRSSGSNVSSPVSFATQFEAVIPDGESEVTGVFVKCAETGTRGNIPALAINSFSSSPFAGASATNETAFSNGVGQESDDELRERIRLRIQTLSRGTPQAITGGVLGLYSPVDNKTVLSATLKEPLTPDAAAILYIDDGTGFEPTYAGQGYEGVITEAAGTEQYFQIGNFPVTPAIIISGSDHPYNLSGGETLHFEVDGIGETFSFVASDFDIAGTAKADEVVRAINNRSLIVDARTINGLKGVMVFPRTEADSLAVTGGTANEILDFPTNTHYAIRLYKNDSPLSRLGVTAFAETGSQSSWTSLSSPAWLKVAVDGKPAQYLRFTNTGIMTGSSNAFSDMNSFADAVSFNDLGVTIVSASLGDWVRVINSALSGATASVSGTKIRITSNTEKSSSSKIVISAASPSGDTGAVDLYSIQDWSNVIPAGSSSDFAFNRFSGEGKLDTPLAAKDTLTVGTEWTRAHLTTSEAPSGSFSISITDGRKPVMVVCVGGTVTKRSLASIVAGTTTVTATPTASSDEVVITASSGIFSDISEGDYLYLGYQTEDSWLSTNICGKGLLHRGHVDCKATVVGGSGSITVTLYEPDGSTASQWANIPKKGDELYLGSVFTASSGANQGTWIVQSATSNTISATKSSGGTGETVTVAAPTDLQVYFPTLFRVTAKSSSSSITVKNPASQTAADSSKVIKSVNDIQAFGSTVTPQIIEIDTGDSTTFTPSDLADQINLLSTGIIASEYKTSFLRIGNVSHEDTSSITVPVIAGDLVDQLGLDTDTVTGIPSHYGSVRSQAELTVPVFEAPGSITQIGVYDPYVSVIDTSRVSPYSKDAASRYDQFVKYLESPDITSSVEARSRGVYSLLSEKKRIDLYPLTATTIASSDFTVSANSHYVVYVALATASLLNTPNIGDVLSVAGGTFAVLTGLNGGYLIVTGIYTSGADTILLCISSVSLAFGATETITITTSNVVRYEPSLLLTDNSTGLGISAKDFLGITPVGSLYQQIRAFDFDGEDTVVAVVDNDPQNKTYPIPLYRNATPTNWVTDHDIQADDADSNTSPSPSFAASTWDNYDFAGYKALFKARNVIDGFGANNRLLFRSAVYGQSRVRVGISYPDAPDQGLDKNVSVYGDSTDASIILASGARRVLSSVDSTTQVDVTVNTTTKVITFAHDGTGTIPNFSGDGVVAGDIIVLDSSKFPNTTGVYRVLTVAATTLTAFDAAGLVSVADNNKTDINNGMMIFPLDSTVNTAQQVCDFVNADPILSEIIACETSGTASGTITKSTVDDSSIISEELTGTATFTSTSTSVTGSNTKFLTEVRVGDWIMSTSGEFRKVASITSDTLLTLASAYRGGTLTNVAAKITGWVHLLDGELFVKSFRPSGSIDFSFKEGTRNDYTASPWSDLASDPFRLVPVTADNVADHLSKTAITPLSLSASIGKTSEGSVQVVSQTLGADGSVEITGGKGNSSVAPVLGNASIVGGADPSKSYISVKASKASASGFHPGQPVKVVTAAPYRLANPYDSTASVTVSFQTQGINRYEFGAKSTAATTLTTLNITNPSGHTWRYTIGVAGNFNNARAGDVLDTSALTGALSGSNCGRFHIVDVDPAGTWVDVLQKTGVVEGPIALGSPPDLFILSTYQFERVTNMSNATEFHVENITGNHWRLRWNGAGANPKFEDSYLYAGDYVVIGSSFDTQNQGRFRLTGVYGSGTEQIVYYENENAVVQSNVIATVAQLKFYTSDSVFAGDTLVVSGDGDSNWFSQNNRGSFEIVDVGFSTGYYVDVSNSYVTNENKTLASNPSGFYAISATDFTDYRTVANISVDPADESYRTILLSPDNNDGVRNPDKISDSYSSYLAASGKLAFPSGIHRGVDGYKYWTGVLQEAQWTVDGLDFNPSIYPGLRAAGPQVEVIPPLVQRIKISLDARPVNGVNVNSVADQIISAVLAYINSLGVGEDVVMSEIVSAAQSVPGVDSITITYPAPAGNIAPERVTIQDNEKAIAFYEDITVG